MSVTSTNTKPNKNLAVNVFFFFSSPGNMDFCDRLGSWSAKEQQENKILAIVEDVVSIVAMSGPSYV